MMRQKLFFNLMVIFLVVMILGLSGCDLIGASEPELSVDEQAQTAIAATVAVEQHVQTVVAETMAASGQIGEEVEEPVPDIPQVPEPTNTVPLVPTLAFTPTITLTLTPEKPMVTVSRNTNCRTGPGTEYDIIGALNVGQQAEVVGTFVEWNYWIIKNPDKPGDCWLWGEYATVTGETANLPKFTPPPTPTPSYNWTGTWTTSFGKPGEMHETFTVTLTQATSSVTGSFTIGTTAYTLSGTLSPDYITLSGTWSDSTTSGPFLFKLISPNQFIGNRDSGTYEWCGSRAGAGLPSPCMGP